MSKNERRTGTGARIGIVVAIVAAIAAIAMIPARASSASGADVVEVYQGPGFVFDPNDWSPLPAIGGLVDADTVRVTVALQNKANGLWWQPNDTCPTSNFPTCGSGVLGQRWEKNTAMLLDGGNEPGQQTFSFQMLPPDGTYMVGIKAYDQYGASGRTIWQEIAFATSGVTEGSASADLAPPLPANTYNEGRVVLQGGLSDSSHTALIGLYNRDLGRWVDASGSPLSAKERLTAQLGGDPFFGFSWDLELDLPPGRYAYGADNVDENGVRVGGTPWTYFTVQPCSVRCANVSLTSAVASWDADGVCFSVTSSGDVKLALRNDTTGEWLQNTTPEFGRAWNQFNNLTTLLQAGPDDRNSCFNDDPLDLPPGDYHLGVKTYDAAGTAGPKAWFGFTIPS